MEKVLNFLTNTNRGKRVTYFVSGLILLSFLIGVILSAPAFWMGGEFETTWMAPIIPYVFVPFFGFLLFMTSIFAPFMWYVATDKTFKGDKTKKQLLIVMAIILSMIPGGFIFFHIAEELSISDGIHNLPGIFICAILYLLIIKVIFKKPFSIAQNFTPFV